MRKQIYSYSILATLSGLLISVLLTTTAIGATSGKVIKCWKNDLGIRECGSIVPPEYSQRRIEVLNERGLVVEVIDPPKTREELEKEREAERLRKQQETIKKEQEHQDAILLNAYATERDLLLARDTNVKAAQGQLDIAQGNLKVLENSLTALQNRAGDYERSGSKPPPQLVTEINQIKQQISEKTKSIQKKKDEKAAIEKRFDNDLARFRKLKGIKN